MIWPRSSINEWEAQDWLIYQRRNQKDASDQQDSLSGAALTRTSGVSAIFATVIDIKRSMTRAKSICGVITAFCKPAAILALAWKAGPGAVCCVMRIC